MSVIELFMLGLYFFFLVIFLLSISIAVCDKRYCSRGGNIAVMSGYLWITITSILLICNYAQDGMLLKTLPNITIVMCFGSCVWIILFIIVKIVNLVQEGTFVNLIGFLIQLFLFFMFLYLMGLTSSLT